MSQITQPSPFTNVLPMSLHEFTLAPSSLLRVGKILIYANIDYHKLHYYTYVLFYCFKSFILEYYMSF